jgi:NAD-dependent dihydropyrimidine dehydrogenase PreA subunit
MLNTTNDRVATQSETCNDVHGRVAPIVDRNRCEGKADCVRVCPFDVFEIATLTAQQRSRLTLIGRMKAWVHGGKQGAVANPYDCHACRLCITACPEHALHLAPITPRAAEPPL